MTIDDTLEWRGSPNISGEFFFKINKAIIYPRFNVEFGFFLFAVVCFPCWVVLLFQNVSLQIIMERQTVFQPLFGSL